MGIVLSPFISKKPNSDSLCLGGRIFLLQNLKHGEGTQNKPFFVPQSPSSAFVLWKKWHYRGKLSVWVRERKPNRQGCRGSCFPPEEEFEAGGCILRRHSPLLWGGSVTETVPRSLRFPLPPTWVDSMCSKCLTSLHPRGRSFWGGALLEEVGGRNWVWPVSLILLLLMPAAHGRVGWTTPSSIITNKHSLPYRIKSCVHFLSLCQNNRQKQLTKGRIKLDSWFYGIWSTVAGKAWECGTTGHTLSPVGKQEEKNVCLCFLMLSLLFSLGPQLLGWWGLQVE